MSKIKAIGNGFIQLGETLINLTQYKQIKKYDFGYDEDPEGKASYGIMATPLQPSAENIANGVDGSLMIATYSDDEFNEFQTDFNTIIAVFNNKNDAT